MRRTSIALLACLALPGLASGQDAQCTSYSSGSRSYNVCQAAVEGTRLFHPTVGLLLSGGNARPGRAGTLGGLGHVALDLRVVGTRAYLPDLAYSGQGTTIATSDTAWAVAPQLEGGVGLFKGSASGLLGLDLLVSALVIPRSLVDNVAGLQIDSTSTHVGSLTLALGLGGRVQVVDERGLRPAVSLSAMRRTLPRVTYGDIAGGDSYQYAADLTEWNWRVQASKRFGPVATGLGGGFDRYTGDARIAIRNPLTLSREPDIDLDLAQTRTIVFLNAGIDAGGFRLIGEAGWQGGKDLAQVITFEGNDPKRARFFAGATLGVSF